MTDHPDRHRFRFFAERELPWRVGDEITLAADDVEHLRVLRVRDGDIVELVDPARGVWLAAAHPTQGSATLAEMLGARPSPHIEIYAGLPSTGRFDDVVDAAVQAGATTIVPVVDTGREVERVASRRERFERIALAAAKQAKRDVVPQIGAAVLLDEIAPGAGANIVLEPNAALRLDELVTSDPERASYRLLVGPASGISRPQLERMVDAGWLPARLGSPVLRTELAVAVAVAVVAMCARATDPQPA